MKTKAAMWLGAILAVMLATFSIGEARQETPPPQEDLRKQIGTIIVTPGNGVKSLSIHAAFNRCNKWCRKATLSHWTYFISPPIREKLLQKRR